MGATLGADEVLTDRSRWPAAQIGAWLLGALFLISGTAHFLKTDQFAAIVPPYLPSHVLLVQVSGAFELLLGALMFVVRLRRLASLGLMALMLAVFPANIYMAQHSELFSQFPPPLLWGRLPVQALLLVWGAWAGGWLSPKR